MKVIFILTKGESEGYTVKSRDEEFPISNYPLEQTEFFYSQKQGIARNFIIQENLKHFTGFYILLTIYTIGLNL